MSVRLRRCISTWMRSDYNDIGHLLVHGQGSLLHFRRQKLAAEYRTRLQQRRTGRRPWWHWSARVPPLCQPLIVRRVTHHDATPFSQSMLGDDFDLAVDLDTATGDQIGRAHV